MSAIGNATPSPVQHPEKLSPVAVPPARGGGKWKGWLILALVGAGAWAAYEYGYKGMKAREAARNVTAAIPTVKVTAGNLAVQIRVSGVTAAKEFATITAPRMQGPESNRPMVLQDLAASGSIVKKGQLIARIDGQTLQDHIDDVKDTVEAAEADVRKRKAELEIDAKNLQQTLSLAKADLDKAKLDADAAEVKTEVERMLLQLNFEEAQAQYKQLLGDVENTHKRQAADVKILGLTLERHRRHLMRHQNDMKRFTVYSPMDGMVVYQSIWGGSSLRQIEVGDQVYPGQSFMKVVNPRSMTLESRINQTESERFKIGQTATMQLDAFPGLTLQGHVGSIGAIATGGWRQNNYIRTLPIKVDFDTVDPKLIPDLSGSGDVTVAQQESGLVIPRSAVADENGKSYVTVKTAKGFEKREVKVAMTNDTQATIASGLRADEEIRLLN